MSMGYSLPERGWRDKEKRGAGDRASGSTHFEGTRMWQRRGPPRGGIIPSSQALVSVPGVTSTGVGGVEKEQRVPAQATDRGNEST